MFGRRDNPGVACDHFYRVCMAGFLCGKCKISDASDESHLSLSRLLVTLDLAQFSWLKNYWVLCACQWPDGPETLHFLTMTKDVDIG